MEFVNKGKESGSLFVSELQKVERSDNSTYQRIKTMNKDLVEGSSSGNVFKKDMKAVGNSPNNNNVVSRIKKFKATEEQDIQFKVSLPQGIHLTSILGIDIPFKETGNVFQFLEFCSAFGKALGLKEGQAIYIVHELFSKGRTKRQQHSSTIWMMNRLLDLISKDRDMSLSLCATNNIWFAAIGDLLLKSGVLSEDFPPETFEGGVAKYEEMDASRRLKLLNFLCDESLSTRAIRNFIKNEDAESKVKKREAREKAKSANKMEKQLRKTMQSDPAKTHMEDTGASLSDEEHTAILSELRVKAKEAHDEMLKAKEMASKKQRCDAVRTDPILLDDNGCVLWKLNCFEEEPKFLLQGLGTFDDSMPHEKWSAFKAEQKQDIEKFISSKKMKQMQKQKNANVAPSELALNHNSGVIISEQS